MVWTLVLLLSPSASQTTRESDWSLQFSSETENKILFHNWQLYPDTFWDWTGLYLQYRILISKHLQIFEVFFYKKKCFKGFKTNLWSLLSLILAVVPFLLWRYSEHEEATTAVTQQMSRRKRTENAIDSVYWTNSIENVIVEKSLIFSFKQQTIIYL